MGQRVKKSEQIKFNLKEKKNSINVMWRRKKIQKYQIPIILFTLFGAGTFILYIKKS